MTCQTKFIALETVSFVAAMKGNRSLDPCWNKRITFFN